MGLKIVAMPSGFVKDVRGSAVTFMRNNDKEFELSMLMFAVLGGEHPVMVDTGTPPVDYVREHHGYHSFERPDEHEPRRVLAEHGIDPADVRTVIFTHLHWDHCSNTDLFPNATFYVQAEELRFAIDPIPVFRKAYERLPTNEPSWLPVLRRFQTVDGEREIVPGISVVPLPATPPAPRASSSRPTKVASCSPATASTGTRTGKATRPSTTSRSGPSPTCTRTWTASP